MRRTAILAFYLVKNMIFFLKKVELLLILIFFKSENKIRNKSICNFLFGKDIYAKFEFEFENQVTYWKCTVMSRSTPLSSHTYDLY